MQEWLDNNDIFMHSTHNEAKSVIAERFIKLLKAKMSTKKKTDKLETNPKAIKFKVIDRVRITKYKNIISKGYKLVKRSSYYRFCFEN